ncbi:hypothetical protein D3C86_2040880 [compost metagenome]
MKPTNENNWSVTAKLTEPAPPVSGQIKNIGKSAINTPPKVNVKILTRFFFESS